MKVGDVALAALPQADGQNKYRPAVILDFVPPFGDPLLCGISTQLHQRVPELDELIRRSDPDFGLSGLAADSLIRVGYLATLPRHRVKGTLGEVLPERMARMRSRLQAFITTPKRSVSNVFGIIPARYASKRFPGKPLHSIAGKPLIQHVVEQCRKAKSLREVIMATDDERIAEVARKFCRVEMTRGDHPSGSDRIAEVAARMECDAVVNIQGDEPLIDPAVIDAVAGALHDNEMSTAATPIRSVEEYDNANVVKVVVSASGHALYFSRRTIPFVRDAASRSSAEQLAAFPFLKHLGIYGYRREALLRLVKFPVSPLESAEKLEQLRALENGIQIAVVQVNYDSVGVDTAEDVVRVEAILRNRE